MERKESAFDPEDPGYHHITFIPIEHPAAPVGLNIKSIIRPQGRETSSCGEGCTAADHKDHEKKCKCVRFVPTPHYLVYESVKSQSDVRDYWLATPARRLTVVHERNRDKRKHSILFHPSNILILIVCIGIIAVILMTKKKKKLGNPLDILMAFI